MVTWPIILWDIFWNHYEPVKEIKVRAIGWLQRNKSEGSHRRGRSEIHQRLLDDITSSPKFDEDGIAYEMVRVVTYNFDDGVKTIKSISETKIIYAIDARGNLCRALRSGINHTSEVEFFHPLHS